MTVSCNRHMNHLVELISTMESKDGESGDVYYHLCWRSKSTALVTGSTGTKHCAFSSICWLSKDVTWKWIVLKRKKIKFQYTNQKMFPSIMLSHKYYTKLTIKIKCKLTTKNVITILKTNILSNNASNHVIWLQKLLISNKIYTLQNIQVYNSLLFL